MPMMTNADGTPKLPGVGAGTKEYVYNQPRAHGVNWRYIRYADVLLMYAECLNETGNTPSAANYLNMVRTRAGLSNTTATTQKEMSIAIENERMLELCFEGHRWYDLIRRGRITEVMEKHFSHRTQGLNPTFQSSNNGMNVSSPSDITGTPTTWKWTGTSAAVLFGIPYDQIQLSNNWEQNELY